MYQTLSEEEAFDLIKKSFHKSDQKMIFIGHNSGTYSVGNLVLPQVCKLSTSEKIHLYPNSHTYATPPIS